MAYTATVQGLGGAADQRSARTSMAAVLAGLAVCLVLVTAGTVWRLTGGKWAIIETPSMGVAAPVGTLILTRPALPADLSVGDIVTYRPRNMPDNLITHRVVAILDDGSVQVRGDINGAVDPFPVTQDDLVGEVVAHYRGLGWLVRGLPTLLLGIVVLVIGSALYVPTRWRSSVRILGSTMLVAVTSLIVRPFVHPVLVTVAATGDGLHATIVSGGLLPTRVTGLPGHHVDLHLGEVGSVPVAANAAGGPLMVNGAPHLTGWWLVAMIVVCLIPLLWTTIVGLTAELPTDTYPTDEGRLP
ncbi:signal peptidase I [Friedmanniella luteola]|uniref:Signal peptidase I n=1 Tax=Friedmanniella luteola TaxID=546871 RepID=A0A1H1RHG5_9ACTN|nr:S26 family signal peptidase [Friedmanniella luteola]SDS35184.1 signal peptidase I [Friedmanniella luteola]